MPSSPVPFLGPFYYTHRHARTHGVFFISNPISSENFLLTLLTNENILTLPTGNGGEQGPRAGVATSQTSEATACAAGRPGRKRPVGPEKSRPRKLDRGAQGRQSGKLSAKKPPIEALYPLSERQSVQTRAERHTGEHDTRISP